MVTRAGSKMKTGGCGCCCGPCLKRIKNGGPRGCCACVCDAICVTLDSADTDCASPSSECVGCDFIRYQFDWNCDTQSYSGTVSCGNSVVDLKFKVKEQGGVCYMCLTSACLGLDGEVGGDSCMPFSGGFCNCAKFQVGPSSSSSRDSEDTLSAGQPMFFSWDVDFSGCGFQCCGPGTVSIKCANRIFPSKLASNSSSDCPILVCDNCDCVCDCVCIQYNDDACPETAVCETLFTNRTCFDRETSSWHLVVTCDGTDSENDVDLDFRLQKNEQTNDCEILLTSIELGISEQNPRPPEFGATANPQQAMCPGLGHVWDIDLDPGRNISIHLLCARCEDCLPLLPCCSARTEVLPQKLSVEIEITGVHQCTCPGSANVEFDVFFDGFERRGDPFPDPEFNCASRYVGQVTWCDQPATMTVWVCDKCLSNQGITIEFQTCSGGDVHCSTGGTGCDCRSFACDPIFYQETDQLGDAACCSPDDATEMTITIME